MISLKKALFSLIMSAALVVSSSAFAESPGDAKVRAAGEGTVAKVEEAVSLAEKGADKADVIKILSEVRQLQKEFRFEGTERLRQKAGDSLKASRDAVEKGDANAAASLKDTLAIYQEMLKLYKAAH